MLSYFRLPRFQPLAFLLLSISFVGVAPVALSQTSQEPQSFSSEYMKGCLQGIQDKGLDPERGKLFCQCTLTNFLELPDEKIRLLNTLPDEQIPQDPAIQEAVTSCFSTFSQPNQQ